MTLYQFKLIDTKDQLEVIETQAIYLIERVDDNYTYKLYQMDKFYVEEVWHNKYNVRRSFDAFVSEEKLKTYLNKIDLKELNLNKD